MPGRREESRHRPARCRHGTRHTNHQRQCIWLRGPALPRRFRRRHDWRSPKTFRDSIAHAASAIRVGNGLDAGVQMGPVITKESKQRIESLISAGVGERAKPIVDGRITKIPKYESGNFLTPTILDGLPSTSQLANTEIFGPVLSLVHANS